MQSDNVLIGEQCSADRCDTNIQAKCIRGMSCHDVLFCLSSNLVVFRGESRYYNKVLTLWVMH